MLPVVTIEGHRLIEIGLSLLYLGGAGFFFWVILHDGPGFRFRSTGLGLSAAMICLLPVVIARGVMSILGKEPPAAIRWLAPGEGIAVMLSIGILILRPELIGYRKRISPKRTRGHP